MAGEKKKSHVPLPVIMTVANFLKGVIAHREEGFCSYLSPWNDRAVAEHINSTTSFPLSPHHVYSIRLRIFGKLIHESKKDSRLDHLEARIRALEIEFQKWNS